MIPTCEHEKANTPHDIGGLGTFMKEIVRRSKSTFPVVIACLVYLDRIGKKPLTFTEPLFRCPYMVSSPSSLLSWLSSGGFCVCLWGVKLGSFLGFFCSCLSYVWFSLPSMPTTARTRMPPGQKSARRSPPLSCAASSCSFWSTWTSAWLSPAMTSTAIWTRTSPSGRPVPAPAPAPLPATDSSRFPAALPGPFPQGGGSSFWTLPEPEDEPFSQIFDFSLFFKLLAFLV